MPSNPLNNHSVSKIKSPETINSIRIDYIIALLPAILWSAIRFGLQAISLILVSCITILIVNIVLSTILQNKNFSIPLYSVYCGIFLALSFYKSTTLAAAIVASLLCALFLSVFNSNNSAIMFAPIVANVLTLELLPYRINKPEYIPYEYFLKGELPSESLLDFMLGTVDGAIGTISVIALLLGMIYLIIRKVADFRVSFSYVITLIVLYCLFHGAADSAGEAVMYGVLSGEAIFASIFAMTDYSTTPLTSLLKYIKGIFCAAITFILRLNGNICNSVFIAIMISDITFSIITKLVIKHKIAKEAVYE